MSYKNLVIKQGESWSEPVQIYDGLGNLMNLSAYSFECTMKKAYTSKYYTTIGVDVADAAVGTVNLYLTAAETAALKSGRYVYGLRVFVPNQEIDTFALDGIITVEASASISSVG